LLPSHPYCSCCCSHASSDASILLRLSVQVLPREVYTSKV
jgi:hypothetical protein